MRHNGLIWTDSVIAKLLKKHAVRRDEVEEVIYGHPVARKVGSKIYAFSGQTDAGRYLLVITKKCEENGLKPISARDMKESEKKAWRRNKRK